MTMHSTERQAHIERLQDERDDLKRVGTALLQAAILKLNKPASGTMVHCSDNRFRSVDAQLIAAVKKFAALVGLSLGEESEAEALDRKARTHKRAIEVIPHDPEGPKSREDVRCRQQSKSSRPSANGTSE